MMLKQIFKLFTDFLWILLLRGYLQKYLTILSQTCCAHFAFQVVKTQEVV